MMETRHEGVVRQDAQMWKLVAQMEAVKATVAGMIAENMQREAVGASMAYGDEAFAEQAAALEKIAAAFDGI